MKAVDLRKHFPVGGVSLRGKHKSSVKAVDGVSFTIEPGETLAVVGESGCGKTTTARMLLNLEQPTSGQVFLDDEDIHQLSGARLKRYRRLVQAVFQNPYSSLNPQRRIRAAVAEPLIASSDLSKSEVRLLVAEALGRVGLSEAQGDHYPHEFSGGQRQRIAIASALVSNPSIVVLDEPVSALDVSVGAQIVNLFRDLQQDLGLSYLMISHDLSTARIMASQVAVMYLGRIVEMGPTQQIFSSPQHPYTRGLLSASLATHPSRRASKLIVKGEVPSPMNPPSGCTFHTRCPWAQPGRCDTEVPELRTLENGSQASCHFAEAIADGMPIGVGVEKDAVES